MSFYVGYGNNASLCFNELDGKEVIIFIGTLERYRLLSVRKVRYKLIIIPIFSYRKRLFRFLLFFDTEIYFEQQIHSSRVFLERIIPVITSGVRIRTNDWLNKSVVNFVTDVTMINYAQV